MPCTAAGHAAYHTVGKGHIVWNVAVVADMTVAAGMIAAADTLKLAHYAAIIEHTICYAIVATVYITKC